MKRGLIVFSAFLRGVSAPVKPLLMRDHDVSNRRALSILLERRRVDQ